MGNIIDCWEKLKALSKEMEEKDIDAIDVVENTNPSLSKSSKKYKDSAKNIFKSYISYEHAEELVNLVTNISKYDEYNLQSYKETLRNTCDLIAVLGENPVEMLIYSSKALYNNKPMFKNCIIDELKNLYDDERDIISPFRHILLNWSWTECLEIVLKSIKELYLKDLADEVLFVFESNPILRELASDVLISIGNKNHIKSVINFLINQQDNSNEFRTSLRSITKNISKNYINGSKYIYNAYLEAQVSPQIRKILIASIRDNINMNLFDTIKKTLNSNTERYKHNKIIQLLEKCDNYQIATEILGDPTIHTPVGFTEEELLKNIINTNEPIRIRADSIIKLRDSSKDINPILSKLREESDSLNIVASSVLAERNLEDSINYISSIFQYILKYDEDNYLTQEATNHIRRLNCSRNETLKNNILTIAKKILIIDGDENFEKLNRIITMYSVRKPSNEVGTMFLAKLRSTNISKLKIKLFEFFTQNITSFNKTLRDDIMDQLVLCSQKGDLKNYAMDALKTIRKGGIQAPNSNIN